LFACKSKNRDLYSKETGPCRPGRIRSIYSAHPHSQRWHVTQVCPNRALKACQTLSLPSSPHIYLPACRATSQLNTEAQHPQKIGRKVHSRQSSPAIYVSVKSTVDNKALIYSGTPAFSEVIRTKLLPLLPTLNRVSSECCGPETCVSTNLTSPLKL